MIKKILLLAALIPMNAEARVCQSLSEARADEPKAYLRYTQVGERKCWYKGSHLPPSSFREDVRNEGGSGSADTQPNEIDSKVDEEATRLRFEEAFTGGWSDPDLLRRRE